MRTIKQPFAENGIIVSKASIKAGDEIALSYSGLLAQNGADELYVHVGYGEAWEEKEFIPMEHQDGAFHAGIRVKQAGTLNVAFKDSAENWDNNSAQNYSFLVTKKSTTTRVVVADEEAEKPVKITRTAKAARKAPVEEKMAAKVVTKKASTRKSGTIIIEK
jgi:hypothetical protein